MSDTETLNQAAWMFISRLATDETPWEAQKGAYMMMRMSAQELLRVHQREVYKVNRESEPIEFRS